MTSFDFDSRARNICQDIAASGRQLDVICTEGGKLKSFAGGAIHRLVQPTWPFRQRRFIEYNLRAAALAKKIRPNIFHAVDLDTLWAAVTASKSVGGKVIYESRELYTELLALRGRPIVKYFWRSLEKRLINKAAHVVTINESIATELVRRYKIEPPTVAMNVPRLSSEIQPINLRERYAFPGRFVLIFQGILRAGQGIARVIETLTHLPDVSLLLVGDGPYRGEAMELVRQRGLLSRVKFIGMVEPDELPALAAGADAGLVLLEPVALNHRLALPQKLFQYIGAGTPPIVSNQPELIKIVEKDNLGLVLEYGTPESDARAIDDFLKTRLGEAAANCRRARQKYDWNIEGKKILQLYG